MGKQIYDKPVRGLIRDMVKEMGLKKGDVVNKKQVVKWFDQRYPKIKSGTITAHLTLMSTNAPSRVHHKAKLGDDDLLFQIDGSNFRLYDPDTDPPPIYEKVGESAGLAPDEKSKDKLVYEIQLLVDKYFKDLDKSRVEYERRINELEQEKQRLLNELNKERSIRDEITDGELQHRVALLESAPLDVLIREAGVILEVRLRKTSGIDSQETGAKLVDEIFNPQTGKLIFSKNYGEQQGIQMLYRGAMQFIRNPPMHKLIEYPASTARMLIRMIDSLLQLLSEFQTQSDEVTVEDIRRMLRRSPIYIMQRQLYSLLYSSDERGMNYVDLADALNITRLQFAGVLGALGRRINGTQGLENKGGINIIFHIEMTIDGHYLYVMRPILRKALEEEGLI